MASPPSERRAGPRGSPAARRRTSLLVVAGPRGVGGLDAGATLLAGGAAQILGALLTGDQGTVVERVHTGGTPLRLRLRRPLQAVLGLVCRAGQQTVPLRLRISGGQVVTLARLLHRIRA